MNEGTNTNTYENIEPNFFNNINNLLFCKGYSIVLCKFLLGEFYDFIAVDKGLNIFFEFCLTDNGSTDDRKN